MIATRLFSLVFLLSGQTLSRAQWKQLVIGVLEDQADLARVSLGRLPASERDLIHLQPLPYPTGSTEYDQLQTAYEMLNKHQVSVLLGSDVTALAVAGEKLAVPVICTSLVENDLVGEVFYMMPKPTELCRALEELMTVSHWYKVAVIYEDSLDAAVLKHLVGKLDLDLKFGKIAMTAGEELVKRVLLKFRSRDITHYLVMTSSHLIRRILRAARHLGIVSFPNSWFILNLGSEDVSSGILDDLRTNVTTLNLVVPHTVNSSTTLGHDCLQIAVYTDALSALAKASRADLATDDSSTMSIQDRLLQVSFFGDTGHVIFNSTGWRLNLTLSLYNYIEDEFMESGHWYDGTLDTVAPFYTALPGLHLINRAFLSPSLKGRKDVPVVTILEEPFCMLKSGEEGLEGNARYHGFTVDMMEEMSKQLGFHYSLYPVHDGKFGALLDNGEWNGIIGEILVGNATMSFAPLSINAARERAIDFTKPFKTRGITVLMKTPMSQSSYFQFMKPLSTGVWMGTLVSMALATVLLFIYERYSLECRKDLVKLNLKESLWFIFGSIVQGSTESAPVTVPGRILTSAWWFFSLIMISTYTANLAAFLTVKKINPPISSVTDLADQTKIKFGTVRNSGIEMFFRHTRIEPFAKMWVQMSEIFSDVLVNTTEEGFQKVREGDYAFLWDSTVTSYKAATDCSFTEIGPSFDPKGFGMGVPPGAVYLEELSMALLKLGDRGFIAELEQKYWGESQCAEYDKPTTDETSELLVENAAGMFFVLLGGIVLGFIALSVECFLKKTGCIKPKKPRSNFGVVDLRRE